jgi:hypothetical protein
MRAFSICGCSLLLVPLLGILGCSNSAYVKKGPEVYTNTVKISACVANPDTAQVHKGDTLTWIVDPSDPSTYSINFPKHKPTSSSTVPTGQSQHVTGDSWCSAFGWISTSACVYPYDLVQDGKKTCPDPGVHIH